MPNIKTLAKEAGVSVASASRAMSNPQRVSEVTRLKVLDAAKRIGYTPNRMGAGLRTSKSGNILVIVPDACDTFNFGVVKAMEHAASENGYSVLLGDTQGLRERELAYGDMARAKQADALAVFSSRLPYDDVNEAQLANLPPMVNSCEKIPNCDVPYISIDNELAAYEATKHLIDLGHKHIAAITGHIDAPSTGDRINGYKRALIEHGIEPDSDLIEIGHYNLASGEEHASKLLVKKNRPTAIFCFSDEIAIGCIHLLLKLGYSVPNDMSVIGIDDISFAHYLNPPLTTIAQPVSAIGEKCIEVLINQLKGETSEQSEYILPHKLIIRNSTAPPKQ